MCDLHTKAISRETSLAINEVAKPLRFPAQRPIVRKLTKGIMKEIRSMEKELFSILIRIAKRRGETPPNLSVVRKVLDSPITLNSIGLFEKRVNEDELGGLIMLARQYLSGEEMELLDAAFQKGADGLRKVYEQGILEVYGSGTDEAYKILSRTAKRQDPKLFANIPIRFPVDRNGPSVQQFLNQGLNLITSKITINHKGQALKIITDELGVSSSWGKIASQIYKKVGSGNWKHWVRLSRTESAIANGAAFDDRYADAGIKYIKFSIASAACPICKPLKGIYKFGEHPRQPIHPNCRCHTIGYYRMPGKGELMPTYTGYDRTNPKPPGVKWPHLA